MSHSHHTMMWFFGVNRQRDCLNSLFDNGVVVNEISSSGQLDSLFLRKRACSTMVVYIEVNAVKIISFSEFSISVVLLF